MGTYFYQPYTNNDSLTKDKAVFGGDFTTDKELKTPIYTDRKSKNIGIPNYDFLATDGRTMASGAAFQQDEYSAYEKVVSLNLGLSEGITNKTL